MHQLAFAFDRSPERGTPLPTDNRESSILTTLFPASGYTAVVSGANGATGIALVEVYALN